MRVSFVFCIHFLKTNLRLEPPHRIKKQKNKIWTFVIQKILKVLQEETNKIEKSKVKISEKKKYEYYCVHHLYVGFVISYRDSHCNS